MSEEGLSQAVGSLHDSPVPSLKKKEIELIGNLFAEKKSFHYFILFSKQFFSFQLRFNGSMLNLCKMTEFLLIHRSSAKEGGGQAFFLLTLES